MKVFVNNIRIEVFAGAKAGDAVQAYYRRLNTNISEPFPLIFDKYRNLVEPDGALTPDNQLFIVESDNITDYE
jgi:hypothetical protein